MRTQIRNQAERVTWPTGPSALGPGPQPRK